MFVMVGFITSLYAYFFNTVVSVLEGCIIIDGLSSALSTVCDWTQSRNEQNIKSREARLRHRGAVVERCKNTYILPTTDRYVMYLTLHILWYITGFSPWLCIASIPWVQNWVLRLPWLKTKVDAYLENRNVFFKYTGSKLFLRWLQQLDSRIVKIKNYHIFLLYKTVSSEYLGAAFKNMLWMHLLYVLRSSETTYYYYKAIKLSFFYNTGFLFDATMSRTDAVYVVNLVIREQRWDKLKNLDAAHALYKLVSLTLVEEPGKEWDMSAWRTVSTHTTYYVTVLSGIWSLITLFKIIHVSISSTLIALLCTISMLYPQTSAILDRKRCITLLIAYVCVVTQVYDVFVALFIVMHRALFLACTEIAFYVQHKSQILKVIKYYKRGDRVDDYTVVK